MLTHISLASLIRDIGKQSRPRSDAVERGCHRMLHLIRVYTVCLQECSIKQTNENWNSTPDNPENGNGPVQLISMEKSTGQIWVKQSNTALEQTDVLHSFYKCISHFLRNHLYRPLVSLFVLKSVEQMTQMKKIWASSWDYRQPAKAQANLRICAVSLEPSLLHTWSTEVDEGSDQKDI